mgnify:CR=1 FL=1
MLFTNRMDGHVFEGGSVFGLRKVDGIVVFYVTIKFWKMIYTIFSYIPNFRYFSGRLSYF